MLLNNPLTGQTNSITEIEGKLYWNNQELKEITEEQKKQSKTGANYYCENDRNINDNNFFIHLNKDDKTFYIAETFDKNSHTVWLKDENSITFHNNNNIVFRNDKVKKIFPHQNEEEANKIIKYQYETLKGQREFVLFNDPLKDSDSEKIYLERLNDKWFKMNEELKPLTEEQKSISKTQANYSVVNSKGTFLFHVDEKTKQVTLAETINNNEHTVWLKNNERITYFKHHTVVTINEQFGTLSSPYDGHPDLNHIIQKSYSGFTTYQPVINNENQMKPVDNELIINSKTTEIFKSPNNENTVNITKQEKLNTNKNEVKLDNQEKLGYFKGLRKELRDATEASGSLMIAYGVKDMLTKGTGLKKHKFLKLGTAAGVVAVVAASPVAGTVAAAAVVTGALVTLGAAFNAALVTAIHTSEYVEDKIKNTFGSNKDLEPQAKSMVDVKSSISKIRSESFDSHHKKNQHNIK